jgi:hypothetical protein
VTTSTSRPRKCGRWRRPRSNVAAGFELAERLLKAKDPQEMGAVYQNHLKEQMEKMSAQFRELGTLISKPPPVDLNK